MTRRRTRQSRGRAAACAVQNMPPDPVSRSQDSTASDDHTEEDKVPVETEGSLKPADAMDMQKGSTDPTEMAKITEHSCHTEEKNSKEMEEQRDGNSDIAVIAGEATMLEGEGFPPETEQVDKIIEDEKMKDEMPDVSDSHIFVGDERLGKNLKVKKAVEEGICQSGKHLNMPSTTEEEAISHETDFSEEAGKVEAQSKTYFKEEKELAVQEINDDEVEALDNKQVTGEGKEPDRSEVSLHREDSLTDRDEFSVCAFEREEKTCHTFDSSEVFEGDGDLDDGDVEEGDDDDEDGADILNSMEWVEELWKMKKAEEAKARGSDKVENSDHDHQTSMDISNTEGESLVETSNVLKIPEECDEEMLEASMSDVKVKNEQKSTESVDDEDEVSVAQGVNTVKECSEADPQSMDKSKGSRKSADSTEALDFSGPSLGTLKYLASFPHIFSGPAFNKDSYSYCVCISGVHMHELAQYELRKAFNLAGYVCFGKKKKKTAVLEMGVSSEQVAKLMSIILFVPYIKNDITFEVDFRSGSEKSQTEGPGTSTEKTLSVMPATVHATLKQKSYYIQENLKGCGRCQKNSPLQKDKSLFIGNIPNSIPREFLALFFPKGNTVGMVQVTDSASSAVIQMKSQKMAHDHLISFPNFSINGQQLELSTVSVSQEEAVKKHEMSHKPATSVGKKAEGSQTKDGQKQETPVQKKGITGQYKKQNKTGLGQGIKGAKQVQRGNQGKAVQGASQMKTSPGQRFIGGNQAERSSLGRQPADRKSNKRKIPLPLFHGLEKRRRFDSNRQEIDLQRQIDAEMEEIERQREIAFRREQEIQREIERHREMEMLQAQREEMKRQEMERREIEMRRELKREEFERKKRERQLMEREEMYMRREMERQREIELQIEAKRQQETERQTQQRQEIERQREMERQRIERQRELKRQKMERQREMKRQQEAEIQREFERQQEITRQRNREDWQRETESRRQLGQHRGSSMKGQMAVEKQMGRSHQGDSGFETDWREQMQHEATPLFEDSHMQQPFRRTVKLQGQNRAAGSWPETQRNRPEQLDKLQVRLQHVTETQRIGKHKQQLKPMSLMDLPLPSPIGGGKREQLARNSTTRQGGAHFEQSQERYRINKQRDVWQDEPIYDEMGQEEKRSRESEWHGRHRYEEEPRAGTSDEHGRHWTGEVDNIPRSVAGQWRKQNKLEMGGQVQMPRRNRWGEHPEYKGQKGAEQLPAPRAWQDERWQEHKEADQLPRTRGMENLSVWDRQQPDGIQQTRRDLEWQVMREAKELNAKLELLDQLQQKESSANAGLSSSTSSGWDRDTRGPGPSAEFDRLQQPFTGKVQAQAYRQGGSRQHIQGQSAGDSGNRGNLNQYQYRMDQHDSDRQGFGRQEKRFRGKNSASENISQNSIPENQKFVTKFSGGPFSRSPRH